LILAIFFTGSVALEDFDRMVPRFNGNDLED
jgi:hypothetical protein